MFLDLLYRLFRNIYRLSSFDPIAWAENFLPNHIVFCLLDFFQSSSSWCSFVTENKKKIIYVIILIHRIKSDHTLVQSFHLKLITCNDILYRLWMLYGKNCQIVHFKLSTANSSDAT